MIIVGTLPQLSRWTMIKLAATALQSAITGWEPGCLKVDRLFLPARRSLRDGRVEFIGIVSHEWKRADQLSCRFVSNFSLLLMVSKESGR